MTARSDRHRDSSSDARELLDIYRAITNWGRWGDDDERGTLNLITESCRREASRCVVDGRAVMCGRPIPAPANPARNPEVHVLKGGDVAPAHGYASATDFIGIATHGPAYTHVDAPSHVFHDGLMYNGRAAALVRSTGAAANDVASSGAGLIGRGVLLDVPPLRGAEYIDPGEPVDISELQEAERRAGATVHPGDLLLVRVGRHVRESREPGSGQIDGQSWMAGLHPNCLPWLHEHGVALLGSDSASDALPSRWPVAVPIHVGCLVYMGMPLLDNGDLDDLAEACRSVRRWTFLFSVGALNIAGATGCPVNPIAVL